MKNVLSSVLCLLLAACDGSTGSGGKHGGRHSKAAEQTRKNQAYAMKGQAEAQKRHERWIAKHPESQELFRNGDPVVVRGTDYRRKLRGTVGTVVKFEKWIIDRFKKTRAYIVQLDEAAGRSWEWPDGKVIVEAQDLAHRK